ncbi:MAG: hypothetical protein GTO53_01505, partial [Planctomycetales bacterium]|nr:hypothetical protein [Planctomycetales bacterium]NIM07848.1 hypothetical protein [Planctomycetales bacterium]NIN07340.1 hypothetical protein [Planctomycetales bacterium]NIN76443.1 hypothetical protein [Planctomycetales bacterium]NIO33639.1 hypothetical protein [Planctomycetales bacterium]
MQNSIGQPLLPAVLAVLLASSSWTAFAADSVRYRSRDGQKSLRGEITRITPEEIAIDDRGAEEVISVGNILSVSFDDEPDELDDARRRIRSGDYLEAIQLIKKIDLSQLGNVPPAITQDIQFYFAYSMAQRALAGAESLKEAGGLMLKFVNDNQDSYHYFEANEIIGDLLIAMGKPEQAESFYDKAAKAPWPEAKLRITLARARIKQSQNDHAAAIAQFEQVLRSGEQSDLAKT